MILVGTSGMNEQHREANELLINSQSCRGIDKTPASPAASETCDGTVVSEQTDDTQILKHQQDLECVRGMNDTSISKGYDGDGGAEVAEDPPLQIRRAASTFIPSESMPTDHYSSGNEVATEPTSPAMEAPRRRMVQGEIIVDKPLSLVPTSHPSLKAVTTWSSGVKMDAENQNTDSDDGHDRWNMQRSKSTVTTATMTTSSTLCTFGTTESNNLSPGTDPPLPPLSTGDRRSRRTGNNNLLRLDSLEKSRIATTPASLPGAVPFNGTITTTTASEGEGATRQEYAMPGATSVSGSNDGAGYYEKIRLENEQRLLQGPRLDTHVSEDYDQAAQDEGHRQDNDTSFSKLQREYNRASNQDIMRSPRSRASTDINSKFSTREMKQQLLRSPQKNNQLSSKMGTAAFRPSGPMLNTAGMSSSSIDVGDSHSHDDSYNDSFHRVEAFLVQDDEDGSCSRNSGSRQVASEEEVTRRRLEEIARREEALSMRESQLQQSILQGTAIPSASVAATAVGVPTAAVAATATVTGTSTRPTPGMAITHATPLTTANPSLARIAHKFRREMPVSTHIYHMKKYKRTFTGVEAVNYFLESRVVTTRHGGALLGRRLLEELSLFHHVCNDHTFKDANLFYRFYEDDEANDSSSNGDGSSMSSSLDIDDDRKMPAKNKAGIGRWFRGKRSNTRSKSPRERSRSDQIPSQIPRIQQRARSTSAGGMSTLPHTRVRSSIPRFGVHEIKYGKILTPDDKRLLTALVDNILLDPNFGSGGPEDDVRRVDMACQLSQYNAAGDSSNSTMRRNKKNRDFGLYIVKTVPHDLMMDGLSAEDKKTQARSIQKLKSEISLLSQVHHEHIVAIEGVSSIFDSDSHIEFYAEDYDCSCGKQNHFPTPYFFLTENYTSEGTLKQRLDTKWNKSGLFTKRSPEATFLDRVLAATDLASAISFLHSRNIMHGDIQPINIGFSVNPLGTHSGLKLFNFHRARKLYRRPDQSNSERPPQEYDVSLVSFTKLAGALPYAAPEIAITDDFCCGLGVDTYAFGIILWEIITLEKAVDDFHQFLMEDKKFKGSITPRLDGNIPFQLHDLLKQCWNDRHFRPRMNVVHTFMANYEKQMRGTY